MFGHIFVHSLNKISTVIVFNDGQNEKQYEFDAKNRRVNIHEKMHQGLQAKLVRKAICKNVEVRLIKCHLCVL